MQPYHDCGSKPNTSSVSATLEYADYTAWGRDKDITRTAVCTLSETMTEGQATQKMAITERRPAGWRRINFMLLWLERPG